MTENVQINAYKRALKCFPGGVNSPVRAFKAVGSNPVFIKSAYKSCVTSIDDISYIDYVGSWGPMILGHADRDVVEAVCKAAERSLSFGAPTQAETELAELIKEAFPNIEKMRFVSSGTEATMSAIRLARGYTRKNYIIKIDGAYHGHGDSVLVSAGSGVATFVAPGCPGIPDTVANNTLVVPYNDVKALEKCFEKYQKQIACVITEPVCGNMGVVLPQKNYLASLRKLCTQHNALLIFDEVMTGFRACFGGVSKIENVEPDITCLGKVVGGGMPLAVYGGKAEVMACVSPDGPVYQAGTLSGNPIAVAAGMATLRKIKSIPTFYCDLEIKSKAVEAAFKKAADDNGVRVALNRFGSMMTVFFTENEVTDYESAKKSNLKFFAEWFNQMLKRGIYLAPSQFEAAFVSITHSDKDIEKTAIAAREALKASLHAAC